MLEHVIGTRRTIKVRSISTSKVCVHEVMKIGTSMFTGTGSGSADKEGGTTSYKKHVPKLQIRTLGVGVSSVSFF